MTETTPINIEFDHKLAEHIRAMEIYRRTTFNGKSDKVVAIIMVFFAVVLFMIEGFNWWSIIFIAFAFIAWFNLLIKLIIYLAFKRNPKFHERYKLTFDHDCIHFKILTIDSILQWSHYHKLLEDEQLFLLVYGKMLYSVIPKRAFKDVAEQDAFRELAKRMIGMGKDKP